MFQGGNTGNKVIGFSVWKAWSLRHQGMEESASIPLPHDPYKRLQKISELEKGQRQSSRKENLVISESLRINTELCPISLGWGEQGKDWGTKEEGGVASCDGNLRS